MFTQINDPVSGGFVASATLRSTSRIGPETDVLPSAVPDGT
jgi:hypothetical protein